MTIGEALERIRRARRVQQKSLAAKLGWTPQSLNRILTGKIRNPSFESVADIAAELHVTVDDALRVAREGAWDDLAILEYLRDESQRRASLDAAEMMRRIKPELAEVYESEAAAIAARMSEPRSERDRRIMEQRFLDEIDRDGGYQGGAAESSRIADGPPAQPSRDKLMRFEIPPEEFEEGDYDYPQTYRGGETEVTAGATAGAFDEVDVSGEIAEVLNPTLRDVQSGRYGVVRVKGDSMMPRLHDGDLVLVDTQDKEPRPNRIMAVYRRITPEERRQGKKGGSTFGYVHRVGDSLILTKANAGKYPPVILTDREIIQGTVKKRLAEDLE
jgi:transcriptional regulator with XRE-family HTH domain